MERHVSLTLLGLGLFACTNSEKTLNVFNALPEAEITSHADGDIVYEGYTITLKAALSDPNHNNDDLQASWSSNGTELCPLTPPDINGDSICTTVIQVDQSKIKVEVRDPKNGIGESEVNLTVTPTQAPEAEISSPVADSIYYSDRLLTFSGIAKDAEDAPQDLLISWESSLDGVLSINTNINQDGEIEGVANLSEGEHYITLSVEDTTGKTSTESVIINVGGPNTAPNCGINTPTDTSQHSRGEIIEFDLAGLQSVSL